MNALFDGAALKQDLVRVGLKCSKLSLLHRRKIHLGSICTPLSAPTSKLGSGSRTNVPSIEEIFQGQRTYEEGDVYFKMFPFSQLCLIGRPLPQLQGYSVRSRRKRRRLRVWLRRLPTGFIPVHDEPRVRGRLQLQPLTVDVRRRGTQREKVFI